MIEFTKLLGLHLKDDTVIEILETYDMQVIYNFDRLHENLADVYWGHARDAGFLLLFDEDQILVTIFLHLAPKDGYMPIERDSIDVTVYETFDEAERDFKENAVSYEVSSGDPGKFLRDLGINSMHKLWIKGDRGRYSVHYQFEKGCISLITLQHKR